MPQVTD